jgi:outer membrane biosynthesis protein TonB
MLPEGPRPTWGIWLLEGLESVGIVALATIVLALGLDRMTAQVKPPSPIETRFIEVAPPELAETRPAPVRPEPARPRFRPRPHDHEHLHPVMRAVHLAPPTGASPVHAHASLPVEEREASPSFVEQPDSVAPPEGEPGPDNLPESRVPSDETPTGGPRDVSTDTLADPVPVGEPGGDGSGWARETRAALPLQRPEPDWPESLRMNSVHALAGARFTIPASGSVRVELTRGTGDVLLDRFLLRTLGRWTFRPALREGQPVDSVLELRIPVDIE